MNIWSTTLPTILAKLHELAFDYNDGEGIDFEPYQSFLSSEETLNWFKTWTGNSTVDGSQFRVFGQDGTGGYVALWFTLSETVLEEQPVVFLGSEGDRGIVATNLDEYLWLLADGIGPLEAIAYPELDPKPNPQFTEFARMNSKVAAMKAQAVLARANAAYPSFSQYIDSLCG
ncbi:hypothetical protein AAKU64_000059 [Undibacterium sp. GrIS 1.8]|uniref:hypothetical protein n=1 Tax=unclassified Undibacterium TaxID=2630295 RepID=UPI00339719E2